MRKTATRTIFATAAVVPLAFLAVAPASAAPTDVTADFTTSGNTVTATFTNNTGENIGCEFVGLDAPYDPASGNSDYVFADGLQVFPGQIETRTAVDLIAGEQVFVEWVCVRGDYQGGWEEVWGSGLVDALDGGPYMATDQVTTIVVGVGVVPWPPVDTCTGSVCLPTGSFGF